MLTRNGWALAVLAVATLVLGVWLDYDELVVLGLAFVGVLAFAVAWLALRPRLEVRRDVIPVRVSEGEDSAGVLHLSNVGHRRCPPVVASEAFAGGSIAIALPSLAAGADFTTNYLLPATRRGYYAVGPLQIAHSDPLRLISVTQRHGSEATLWVHPRTHRMSPVPTGRTQDLEGPTSAGAPRGGIAFHSLREYEPGDDLRLIHWRSSARLDTLMVKHTVITNEPKILVLLDTSEEPYDDESFEDAVRVAASLVIASSERRFPTELRTTGGVFGSIDATGAGRTDVLDKLAAVRRSKSDEGLSSLTKLAAKREHGVSVGVVTGQPTQDQALAVGRVRSRYQMVTLVQLGERLGRPGIHVQGVLSVSADTSEDLARVWRVKVGS